MRVVPKVSLTTLAVILAGCTVPSGLGPGDDSISLAPLLEDVPDLMGLEWVEAPPLPRAMQDMACTVHGGDLWAIGGIDRNSLPSAQVQIYDPEQQRWSVPFYIPVESSRGIHGAAAVSLDDRVQVLGGYESIGRTHPSAKVYEFRHVFFDKADTSMPYKLAEATPVGFGDAQLLWGGTQDGRLGDDGVLRYNEQAREWTRFSTIPSARADAAVSFQSSDALYIIGGWTEGPRTPLDSTVAVDFSSGDVEELAPVPVPRIAPAAGAWGDQMWLAGGLYNDTPTQEVLVFDFDTRTWFQGPDLPVASAQGCAVELQDGIHIVGGTKPDGRGAINDHYVIRTAKEIDSDDGTLTDSDGSANGTT